jgi:signal transduction histidine kinase
MLLDLSQIQSGNFRTRPQRIDIHEVINRQLAAIEAPAERKGIKIIYRRDVGEHIIETDEYCLSHALANILDNAMKFTDQGHITLSLLHRIPYSLSITIEDTGRGISEDFLRNIWLPLSQEGADGIRAHRGIGLGLTLTNEYLARINARVGVSSILNRGSIFTIDLDMHPADR